MAGVSGADLLEWWSEWPKWSGWGRGRGSTWIGECSSCLLHPRHHDCDSQIHNLVSLQRAPLQPYCPPETHLYQEQLRWKSQQPCYPPHHFGIIHVYFSIPLYSDQVLACFQFRLCVAGSQSVTEVAPPKKWVTSQHCTRLKKEIKVAPAASKKEVKSWRLCKLKKKNSNSEKGKLKIKPFHAYKRTKAEWVERILL